MDKHTKNILRESFKNHSQVFNAREPPDTPSGKLETGPEPKGTFNLSDIFETRKFCVYCRAASQFCKCNNEIKWVVWQEIIKGDVKEFIAKIEEINIWQPAYEWMCIKRKDLYKLSGGLGE